MNRIRGSPIWRPIVIETALLYYHDLTPTGRFSGANSKVGAAT